MNIQHGVQRASVETLTAPDSRGYQVPPMHSHCITHNSESDSPTHSHCIMQCNAYANAVMPGVAPLPGASPQHSQIEHRRPDTRPDGVPEALDATVRLQIQFFIVWEMRERPMWPAWGPSPGAQISRATDLGPVDPLTRLGRVIEDPFNGKIFKGTTMHGRR